MPELRETNCRKSIKASIYRNSTKFNLSKTTSNAVHNRTKQKIISIFNSDSESVRLANNSKLEERSETNRIGKTLCSKKSERHSGIKYRR